MAEPGSFTAANTGWADLRRRLAGFVRPLPHRKQPFNLAQPGLSFVASKQGADGRLNQGIVPLPARQRWKHDLQRVLGTIHREKWTVFAFGGTARGLLRQGPSLVPRDVDLVFSEEHFGAFERRFQTLIQDVNRFGGLRMRAGQVDIDAWPLPRTWAFKQSAAFLPNFENLPRTTFLNIDALAVELFPRAGAARRIFDGGCSEAHQRRVIDINFLENPLPDLCVVRSLYYAYKFDFGISAALRNYLCRGMSNFSLPHLMAVQARHYGQIWFGSEMLGKIAGVLRRRPDQPLSCAQLFGLRHRQRKLIWTVARAGA